MKKRVVILGGGFGGLYTALEMERSIARDPDVEVTLVNRDNFFLFTPMLHEVAASDLDTTHIVNTIDATLWYFEAVRSLLQYTNDYAFVENHLYSVLAEIIDCHIRGTRYGIKMDADGLIASSDPSVQLTWMDAKIGDWVVTPRNGKAVEIQALWYNALRTMEAIAKRIGNLEEARKYSNIADLAKRSFTNCSGIATRDVSMTASWMIPPTRRCVQIRFLP